MFGSRIQSYFRSCINLSDECPFLFFNQNVHMFNVFLAAFYGSALLILFVNMMNDWNIEILQNHAGERIKLIRNKLKYVKLHRRMLTNVKSRTERQTETSGKCIRMILTLRAGALKDFTRVQPDENETQSETLASSYRLPSQRRTFQTIGEF